ncbi:MAG: hypothetical protein AABY22_37145 [Nanoarchaeota archaeon]
MANIKHFIFDKIFTWLSFLSLAVFTVALYVKLFSLLQVHVNTILIISAISILFFVIIGKISASNLKRKAENIIS